MRALLTLLTAMSRLIALIGFGALLVYCAVTMADALARSLGWPRVPGLGDLGEVLLPVLIASCFPAGLLQDRNIAVTLLGKALQPGLGPLPGRWLTVLGASATLLIFAVVVWRLGIDSWHLVEAERVTSSAWFLAGPWWVATTILFLLALPIQLWVLAARILEALGHRPLVPDPDRDSAGGMHGAPE